VSTSIISLFAIFQVFLLIWVRLYFA